MPTRYKDLLDLIPKGSYYDANGIILPYKNNNTEFSLVTNTINTKYRIVLNNIEYGFVTTDSTGIAKISILLPLGDTILELFQENSTNKYITYITTKNIATLFASEAEQLENIDEYIENTLASFRLHEAKSIDIDDAHGVRLITPNEFAADIETYREILQFQRQAFRNFGGRLSCKLATVASITQINPMIFNRYKNAPRWILGKNSLDNGYFNSSIKPVDSSDLATEINSAGIFVSNVSIDSSVNTGTGILIYHPIFKRFKWTPPQTNKFIPILSDTRYYDNDAILTSKNYTIKTGRLLASIESLFDTAGSNPYNINDNNTLYLNIDNKGIFNVKLEVLLLVSNIKDAINSYLHSSNKYEDYRLVASQPILNNMNDFIEIISVSDGTVLNSDPSIITGTGEINCDSSSNISYKSPTDTTYGTAISYLSNLGNIIRLYSNNGYEYIDVMIGYDSSFAPVATSTFNITKQYINQAKLNSTLDKIVIESNEPYIDNKSNITVYDGPFSAHRELFDLDKIHANIQTSIVSGDNQIEVPAGTMLAFNGSDGKYDLPFKVIVGRGIGPTIGSFTGGTSFILVGRILKSIVGITVKTGYTHVKIFDIDPDTPRSCMRGIHKIYKVDEANNWIWLNYNGAGIQENYYDGTIPSTITNPNVHFIAVDPSVLDKSIFTDMAEFNYTQTGTLLQWKPPGASVFGANVNIGSGGFFRLYSDPIDGYKWVDCLVDPTGLSSIPDQSGVKAATTKDFLNTSTNSSIINIQAQLWSSGEVANVISVTPNGATEIWELDRNLNGNYDITLGTYEVLPFRHMPITINGKDSFGDISIDIDDTVSPTIVPSSANIIVGDPSLPSKWLDKSIPNSQYIISPNGKFDTNAVLIDNNTTEVVFESNVDFKKHHIGSKFVLNVWITTKAPKNHILEFKLGFNFGNGLIESSAFTINHNDTTQYPKLLTFSQILPINATQFKIQIKRTTGGSGAERAIVERVEVLQNRFSSLFLGNGTIPRSSSRSKFGSLMYVWSSKQLTTTERSVLGINAPSTDGIIRNSHNAHEQIDAFDVTDIVGGNIKNVRGTISASDFSACNLYNLEIIIRNPSRYSYVKPIMNSDITNENIIFSTVSPYIASLSMYSDKNKDNTILFENDIPIENNKWQFNSNFEIQLLSGYNPNSIYTINYNLLTMIESGIIDINNPSNNGNDTWFFDYLIWNRHESDVSLLKNKSNVSFNSIFEAELLVASDKDKLTSTLYENNGSITRIVPKIGWKYIDNRKISILSNEFNPDAIYTLEYNQKILTPNRQINVISEIRSADSTPQLLLETYLPVNINTIIDGSKRYHQIRLTFDKIYDIDDLRVHSLVLKGINMYGSGSPPPGF